MGLDFGIRAGNDQSDFGRFDLHFGDEDGLHISTSIRAPEKRPNVQAFVDGAVDLWDHKGDNLVTRGQLMAISENENAPEATRKTAKFLKENFDDVSKLGASDSNRRFDDGSKLGAGDSILRFDDVKLFATLVDPSVTFRGKRDDTPYFNSIERKQAVESGFIPGALTGFGVTATTLGLALIGTRIWGQVGSFPRFTKLVLDTMPATALGSAWVGGMLGMWNKEAVYDSTVGPVNFYEQKRGELAQLPLAGNLKTL
jgi:hypothetical protein